MSSGKVHTRASLFLAAGFLAGTLVTQNPQDIEYSVGALIGTVLTPDLDVDKGFVGDDYVRRRFGLLAYKVWRGVWHFYRRSVKHGSELSHFPVLGTTFRLMYLFLFALVIPYVVMSLFVPVNFRAELGWWMAIFAEHWRIFVGLMASDFHHYCMDIATRNDKFDLSSLLSGKTVARRKL